MGPAAARGASALARRLGEIMSAGPFLLRVRMLYWRCVYGSLRRRYQVDPSFRFNGAGIALFGEGTIELGAGSYISEFSAIQASSGHAVRIGRRCRIAHNVRIYTQTAEADSDFRLGDGTPILGDVVIGDGVWIGVNVYIGPGITIGANAVVGANSVVTVDVPANEVWGGVPARRLRTKATTSAARADGADEGGLRPAEDSRPIPTRTSD
jgi:maltose O-acetyltransferase